ncbi:leucine-rich repeat-containing protein 46 [Patagioenas fasciata monilis]|uniref:Leucine-rich repeat-containing protein 46 n=1 Tax=Patagioenas fasciata monilis TaxID=372326 RepID=A0A1V4JQF8_PATFA|nr:leucine-rich repeat-containing protein 46 [Patagioenas fasciata monilis]
MAEQQETLGGHESPGLTLTNSLINTRKPPHPESRSTELLSPPTLHLDRENICAIGRLWSLREIHSLYLQRNQIEKIENLGCFPNLRFLSLAGNRIRRVENLQPLRHLRVLDLSHNQIQTLDLDKLPRSLWLLDLTGNECTHQHGYRERVLGALPHLLQLDNQPIREEEEEGGSSSSEDEDNALPSEPSSPFTADKDFFADLQQELAGRSWRRRREALSEHRARLEELEMLRERRALLLSPKEDGGACTAATVRVQPRPHAKPGTQLPPLPAPGGQHDRGQPRTKAPEEENHSKGARNRQLPPIPCTSTALRGCD